MYPRYEMRSLLGEDEEAPDAAEFLAGYGPRRPPPVDAESFIFEGAPEFPRPAPEESPLTTESRDFEGEDGEEREEEKPNPLDAKIGGGAATESELREPASGLAEEFAGGDPNLVNQFLIKQLLLMDAKLAALQGAQTAAKKPTNDEEDLDDKTKARARLYKVPTPSEKEVAATGTKLPNATEWKNWIELKFVSWASVQKSGFDVALVQGLARGELTAEDRKKCYSQNALLAYVVCDKMDATLFPYVANVSKTDGFGLLKALQTSIIYEGASKKGTLHEKFEKPVPCKRKHELQLRINQWKVDLEELIRLKATPSEETTMKSFKRLVENVKELSYTMEFADMVAPNSLPVLYKYVKKKASEWGTEALDSRLGGDHRDPREICKFFLEGRCTRGKGCPFRHPGGGGGGGGRKDHKGKKKGENAKDARGNTRRAGAAGNQQPGAGGAKKGYPGVVPRGLVLPQPPGLRRTPEQSKALRNPPE